MAMIAPSPPPPPIAPVPGAGGAQAPNAAGLMNMMGLPPNQDQQDRVEIQRAAKDMEPIWIALKQIQRQLDAKPHLTPFVETFLKHMTKGRSGGIKRAANTDNAQPAPLIGSATPAPPMMSGQNSPPAPQPRPFPGAFAA
jgi:hypothetical protein